MEIRDGVWKSETLARLFLDNVRGAIPFAAAQVDVMLRLIHASIPKVERFADLGCGSGILGSAIFARNPEARGLFLDFSAPMLDEAKRRLAGVDSASFALADFGSSEWMDHARQMAPLCAVASGLAIHHQPDARKKALYSEIFSLLKPGGVFVNVEHVSSATPWLESVWDEYFIDALFEHHQRAGASKSREKISEDFVHRKDKEANILAPVEAQCSWLREIGFVDVDCQFKIFEIAVFGGRRPARETDGL